MAAGANDDVKALREDLERLRQDLESLTGHVKAVGLDAAEDVRQRAAERLNELRGAVEDLSHQVGARYRETTETVERRIRDNPLRSVLIALGAGIVLGHLLSRR